ncbi:interferon-induced transmembrane protein-domain-containing protein [Tribonema minus]|uniref:Interferon-induced transmembrane protein-domain-containing protein n=1 Tax=Tribonema minus TaxID=303371 RepID=A0A836CCF3_9STRA|nr:interferon-induced transmembrane protein-domain-containing protein [Tribonema minus]
MAHRRTLELYERIHARPYDYCLAAWFTTVFCCLPIGICALVSSCSVGSLYRRGDVEGARRASRATRNLSLLSFACGIVWLIIVMSAWNRSGNGMNSSNAQ